MRTPLWAWPRGTAEPLSWTAFTDSVFTGDADRVLQGPAIGGRQRWMLSKP
ncbi:hypothetical protein ACW9HR_22190 [Nocardia gipuzkoensis]